MASRTSVAYTAGLNNARRNVQLLAQIPNDDTNPSIANDHMPLDIDQQWLANSKGSRPQEQRQQASVEEAAEGEEEEEEEEEEEDSEALFSLIASASTLLNTYIRRYTEKLSMEDAEIRALVQDFRHHRAVLTSEEDAEGTVVLLRIEKGSRIDPQQQDAGHKAYFLANCVEMIIKVALGGKKVALEREKTVVLLDTFLRAFPASFANDGDIDYTWELTLEMRTQLVVNRAMLDRGPASQKRDITNEVMTNPYGYSSQFQEDLENHLGDRQKALNKATTRMTDAHFDASALQSALFHFAHFVNMAYNPFAENDNIMEDEEAVAIRQISSSAAGPSKRPSIMDRQADAIRIGFDSDLSPRSAIPRKRSELEAGISSPRVAQILRTGHTAIQPNLEQLSNADLAAGEASTAGTTSIAAPVMQEDDFYKAIQNSAQTAIAQQHNIPIDSLSDAFDGPLSMPSVHGPLPIRKEPTGNDPQPNSRPYAPRKRNAYTKEQEEALIEAVAKCGTKWNQIKIEYGGVGRPLHNIDPRQLKDKARIIKLAHLK